MKSKICLEYFLSSFTFIFHFFLLFMDKSVFGKYQVLCRIVESTILSEEDFSLIADIYFLN